MFVDKILYKGEEYTRMHKGTELIAETPLTMEESLTIVGATSISVEDIGTATHNLEYYDTSVGSWNAMTGTITPQGNVYLRGNIHTTDKNNFCRIVVERSATSLNVYIGGNLGSINGGHRVCTSDTIFASLFRDNLTIVIGNNTLAPNLILPYMSGIGGVYERLFMGTMFSVDIPSELLSTTGVAKGAFNSAFRETNIEKAPRLPVSKVIPSTCYANMFNNCSVLTDVYEIDLSADEIGREACLQMFYNCERLEKAPVLNIATLSNGCYKNMFKGCSKLNEISCFATDISATDCTYDWVSGVSRRGTFYKSANMSDWTTGDNGIPEGWDVVDE